MYTEYFDLKENPFRLTPDLDFLFLSHTHSRAMTYMDCSTWNHEGIVVVTGEVGAGKTILIKKFLAELPGSVTVAKIFQTQLDEVEFLQAVLVEFGQNPFNLGKVQLMDMLNTFMIESYSQFNQIVLIVDDAQNLSPRVLEEIRMLSGLETDKEKILNVILVGQPELNETLELPGLEQLLQRIRLRVNIEPLNKSETRGYISHRLQVAGLGERKLFTEECYPLIYKYTRGIPRLINSLCDTALTVAYADDKKTVGKKNILDSIEELGWEEKKDSKAKSARQNLVAPLDSVSVDVGKDIKELLRSNDRLVSEIEERNKKIAEGLSRPLLVIEKRISTIESLLRFIAKTLVNHFGKDPALTKDTSNQDTVKTGTK